MAIESLPLQAGDWGPLNQHLLAIESVTTTGAIPGIRYRLASDGVTVTGYDQLGAVVASGTDGGAVLTACLPAAASVGATISFRNDGNVFPWGSVPALPKAITNKLQLIGNGATIQLSTAGSRFLDFNKVADHDVFQNIDVGGFIVDCNNVNGVAGNHVIIGTRQGVAGVQSRVNIDGLYVHDCSAINVPTPASGAGIVRIAVYLSIFQTNASEVTQNYGKHIRIERIKAIGGTGGVFVDGGTLANGLDPLSNVLLDDIVIEDCYHTTNTVPTVFNAQANFLIGGAVYGGSCHIGRCFGELSGDVSIEIDSMTEATVVECDMRDAGFYHTNYHAPLYPAQQRVTVRDCNVRLVNSSVRPAVAIIPYRAVRSNSIDLGVLELHSSDAYRSLPDLPTGIRGLWVSGVLRRLVIKDFSFVADSVAYSAAANTDLIAILLETLTGPSSGSTVVEIEDLYVKTAGARSGSGTISCEALRVSGGTSILPLSVRGMTVDLGLTGMSASTTRAVNLGATGAVCSVGGTIERLHIVALTDDTGAAAVRFGAVTTGLNIPGRIDCIDCDFAALAGTHTEFLYSTNNLLRPIVFFRGIRWRVFPRPSAAMGSTNFAAATFTTATGNQYIGGDAAEIHFATGTGAGITQIAVSKDNSTYEEVYTQASGAMAQTVLVPVDNGDAVKVTFATTQPTTRVRFKR